MQLEVGKKYRTRDGKGEFKILEGVTYGAFTFTFKGECIFHSFERSGYITHFMKDGRSRIDYETPMDLVEEVTID